MFKDFLTMRKLKTMQFKFFVVLLATVWISPNFCAGRSRSREKLPIREDDGAAIGVNEEEARLAAMSNDGGGQHAKASGKVSFTTLAVDVLNTCQLIWIRYKNNIKLEQCTLCIFV